MLLIYGSNMTQFKNASEFLYHGNCNFLKMLGAKAPPMIPADCSVLCTPTGIMILKMPGFKRNPGK